MIRTLAAAVAIASLTACASVPMGTPSQDAALKKFEPVEGKAAVYIYRNEMMGMTSRLEVLVNGGDVGSTKGLTYLRLELPPGRHKLTSRAEFSDSMRIDVEAGRVYYVWQEVKAGGWWGPTSKLHLVDAAIGQAGVRECGLVAAATE